MVQRGIVVIIDTMDKGDIMTIHHSKLTRSDAGNCWVYGCATVAVLGIIGVIVAVFGTRYMYKQLVENFTDDTPIPMPVVEATEDEIATTIERFDTWVTSMEDEEGATILRLSEQDINILIQHHPDNEEARNYMYVTIDGSEIEGEVSVPLDKLEMESLKGRYFNGSLKLEVSFLDGELKIFIKEASLKGEPVADSVMSGFRTQNLADELNNDPEMEELFENLESIEIIDGILIITPIGASESVETDAPAEADAA